MKILDIFKSFIKRRVLFPVVERFQLTNNKLFVFFFEGALTLSLTSQSTQERLRKEFLSLGGSESATKEQKDYCCPQKKIKPVLLFKMIGAEREFAQSIKIPASQTPLVSVIIPVFNQIAYTLCCLKSMSENLPLTPFEVIVVDDCSTDGSGEILKLVEGVKVVSNVENMNFLRSANRGAFEAEGTYLMFLNNDTQVQSGWLDALVEVFEGKHDVGIVGSKIIYPSGHLQEAGTRMDENGDAVLIGLNDDPDAPKYNFLREVDYCSGVSIIIEKALFRDLNGFDEFFAPCYYEDADLAYRVRERGKKNIYQPKSVICHHLSVSTNTPDDMKMKNILINKEKFLSKWKHHIREKNKVKLFAFYLPQFHTIPENDAWWGEGFTEWTNVRKAVSNFNGHNQPRIPEDLGYYDLRDDEVRQMQIALARNFGVDGFCYYYYWFNGKKLLETPLEMLLSNKSLDFPFCICWANEDWTRTWDGASQSILMKQEYSTEAYHEFIEDVYPLFLDDRYLQIEGRPVLFIYRANRIVNCTQALEIWRDYCRGKGLKGIYLVSVNSFGEAIEGNHYEIGFDAIVEFPPHAFAKPYKGKVDGLSSSFHGRLFDYQATMKSFTQREIPTGKFFRCAMPSWDNTARRQDNPDIFIGSSPELYQEWLQSNISTTKDFFVGDERVTFVNAWNEWAEGNYLEPDNFNQNSYLVATCNATKIDGTDM